MFNVFFYIIAPKYVTLRMLFTIRCKRLRTQALCNLFSTFRLVTWSDLCRSLAAAGHSDGM